MQRQSDAGRGAPGHRQSHFTQQAEKIWLEESDSRRVVNHIQILPLGSIAPEVLCGLATGLTMEFRQPCEFLPEEPDPVFAYNVTRQQYSSTEILATLTQRVTDCTGRLLAVTPVDLYIPILTFVF